MARTRKTVVILVSGKAGSGKSKVASELEKKLNEVGGLTVFRYSFADPIKYIAKAFIKWDGEKDEKGRKLLQEQGRIGREYDKDIWVKHFLNQLDRKAGMFLFNFAIIDDWRFPNELAYLRNNPLFDVVTIRVFGRNGQMPGETATDVSENSLPEVRDERLDMGRLAGDYLYDFQLQNNTEEELLNHKLDVILADISKQYIVE